MRVPNTSTPTINNQPKVQTDNTTVKAGVAQESKTDGNTFQNSATSSVQQVPTAPREGVQRTAGSSSTSTTTPGQASLGSRGAKSNGSAPISTNAPGAAPAEVQTLTGGMSIDSSQEATNIAGDLQAGRINADQAVQRADQHVETMRASGAAPASIQNFYNQLAIETHGNPATVNNQGGQSYQSGSINGETPGHVFQTNVSDAFSRRANQAGFESRMTEALGRSVDPSNLTDVRSYMDHVAGEEGLDGVQRELGDYMTNFYNHGHSISYPGWTNPASNSSTALTDARRDGGNRRIIDCDGYASIAHQVTNGIQGGNYSTRFAHTSGADGGHALLTIEDSNAGEGFVVDNNSVGAEYSFTPGENSGAAARQGVIDSLNTYHSGQEITSNGLGLGSNINTAFQSRSSVD